MWSVRLQLLEQAMNQRGFVIEVWLTEDFFKTVRLGVYTRISTRLTFISESCIEEVSFIVFFSFDKRKL